MKRLNRLLAFTPMFLRSSARREWQLAVLALAGLAPGVAAMVAWLNLAAMMGSEPQADLLRGWLLPAPLLNLLGAQGVLVGAAVVTLLAGCLGLANLYLASIERRFRELKLLMQLGLNRVEVTALLLMETLATSLLGSVVGMLLGIILSALSWPAARIYFELSDAFTLNGKVLLTAVVAGVISGLLFMWASVVFVGFIYREFEEQSRKSELDPWREGRTTILGTVYAGVLTSFVAWSVLPMHTTLTLTGLAVSLGAALSLGGWLATSLYRQLPAPTHTPIWTLAVQDISRHPRPTAGITLALTTGSYSVGIAALSLLDSGIDAIFVVWVALMVLTAGASLVLTAASLASLERRREYALLMALGALPSRVWRLILLEYAIIAVGAGALGALIALINWAWSTNSGNWGLGIAIVVADVIGALVSAWAGAAPVLWRVARRSLGKEIRD
ncbi:MAG: FtsX-like permease family protein [Caldilineaceae bacterium]